MEAWLRRGIARGALAARAKRGCRNSAGAGRDAWAISAPASQTSGLYLPGFFPRFRAALGRVVIVAEAPEGWFYGWSRGGGRCIYSRVEFGESEFADHRATPEANRFGVRQLLVDHAYAFPVLLPN
jgi:hypothetical protein